MICGISQHLPNSVGAIGGENLIKIGCHAVICYRTVISCKFHHLIMRKVCGFLQVLFLYFPIYRDLPQLIISNRHFGSPLDAPFCPLVHLCYHTKVIINFGFFQQKGWSISLYFVFSSIHTGKTRNALVRERFLSCIKHHSKNEFSFLCGVDFLPSVLRDHVLTVCASRNCASGIKSSCSS